VLSAGGAVRIVIIAVWAWLYGAHALGTLSRGTIIAPDLSTRSGQRLRYAVTASDGHDERAMGILTVACSRLGDGYRIRSSASFTDASFVPGFAAVRQRLGSGDDLDRTLAFQLTEDIDAHGALAAAELEVDAFALSATVSAVLRPEGMRGSWSLAGVRDGDYAFPEPVAGEIRSLLLTSAMPSGLRLGTISAMDTLGFDPGTSRPKRQRVLLRVIGEEELDTAIGPALALRVEASSDGRPFAICWCDRSGLLFRERFLDASAELELLGVDAQLATDHL
jgi:hypothetical protein